MKNEIQMKLSEEELLKERGEEAGTKAGDVKWNGREKKVFRTIWTKNG